MSTEYKVPYDGGWHPTRPHPPSEGKVLTGESLKAQAVKWASNGIIEPDAADALCWTADYFSSGLWPPPHSLATCRGPNAAQRPER